ncbi:hypothetical protein ABW19_dt0209709 [Dactylella cylindrospora]|nr:hypothetical protein ABW19_dt0209709 [Dactylella cylindrospora]
MTSYIDDSSEILGLPVPKPIRPRNLGHAASHLYDYYLEIGAPKSVIPEKIQEQFSSALPRILKKISASNLVYAYIFLDRILEEWCIVVITHAPESIHHMTRCRRRDGELKVYVAQALPPDTGALMRSNLRETWPYQDTPYPGARVGVDNPEEFDVDEKEASFGGYLVGRETGRVIGCTAGRIFFQEPIIGKSGDITTGKPNNSSQGGEETLSNPTFKAFPKHIRLAQPSSIAFNEKFNTFTLEPKLGEDGNTAKDVEKARMFNMLQYDPSTFQFGRNIHAVWHLESCSLEAKSPKLVQITGGKVTDIAFFDIEPHRMKEAIPNRLIEYLSYSGYSIDSKQAKSIVTPVREGTRCAFHCADRVLICGRFLGGKDYIYHRDYGTFPVDSITRIMGGSMGRDAGAWEVSEDGGVLGVNVGGVYGFGNVRREDGLEVGWYFHRFAVIKMEEVVKMAEKVYGERFGVRLRAVGERYSLHA